MISVRNHNFICKCFRCENDTINEKAKDIYANRFQIPEGSKRFFDSILNHPVLKSSRFAEKYYHTKAKEIKRFFKQANDIAKKTGQKCVQIEVIEHKLI